MGKTQLVALAPVLQHLYQEALRRSNGRADLRASTIVWLASRGSWRSVRCLAVQWHTAETLRFTNTPPRRVVKAVWPLDPVWEESERMTATVHATEVDVALLASLMNASEEPEKHLPHPLFEYGRITAPEAWSAKARAACAAPAAIG